MLGNPNTGSVVQVISENYFAPTTSADVPSGVAPFVSASTTINQVSLSHQTTVVGKAKSAIAEYSHSGVLYKDALATLQRNFGQPHALVGAHLDKLSNFPPLKMHNSENVINFSSAISRLVTVLGVNNAQAASSDPRLYFSNHIHGQRLNLSKLVQSQFSVTNPVGLQQVIEPVSNSLPQQTFLSTHPVLGNPNTGSVVPVTSENYFAPTTSADVSSGVAPFVPASTTINQVF